MQCILLALVAPVIVGAVVCGCTTSRSIGFRTSFLCPLPGTKLITEESFINDVMQIRTFFDPHVLVSNYSGGSNTEQVQYSNGLNHSITDF